MDTLFSAGELAKYQNISKQTLLYYDKIGLFKPSFTDPENGYRYYSAEQLDYLDSILIMKKIGFSLGEIKNHMVNYTTENSIAFFRRQLPVIEKKIEELSLIRSRLEHRCRQVEQACAEKREEPALATVEETYILYHPVERPYGAKEISIATKQCYAQALSQDLPVFFQCGVSTPIGHVREGRFTESNMAFLTTEYIPSVENIKKLPKGLTASVYHFGSYYDIGRSYRKLLQYCAEHRLEILSDSYEFCINDYVTSRYEEEFITKILFYVERGAERKSRPQEKVLES